MGVLRLTAPFRTFTLGPNGDNASRPSHGQPCEASPRPSLTRRAANDAGGVVWIGPLQHTGCWATTSWTVISSSGIGIRARIRRRLRPRGNLKWKVEAVRRCGRSTARPAATAIDGRVVSPRPRLRPPAALAALSESPASARARRARVTPANQSDPGLRGTNHRTCAAVPWRGWGGAGRGEGATPRRRPPKRPPGGRRCGAAPVGRCVTMVAAAPLGP